MAAKIAAEAALAAPFKVGTKEVYLYAILLRNQHQRSKLLTTAKKAQLPHHAPPHTQTTRKLRQLHRSPLVQ
jgi:hypothetical protein